MIFDIKLVALSSDTNDMSFEGPFIEFHYINVNTFE